MKYALGNMLNGAGGLNPDGLSLDLQFAADKTLTARKGPTPVFSRGSSGTFVNASGLIVGKTAGTTASITPSTQAIGSQVTVTVASDSVVGWVVGQAVSLIVDTDGQDDPDATELWLLGNIVSTTATQLVFQVTSRTAQAGSATIWTLGYRGPRFDHDPANPSVCRGLLIEESRTNLLSRSEEFDQTAWTKLRASISADSTTSPSGNSSADKLVEDSSSGTHMTYRLLNTGALAAHTFSVFAKADGRDFVYLACADNFTANSFAYFNLTNGTLGTVGAGATASITSFGNGWYRCSITATTTATTTNGVYIQTASANGVISYQGNGTSGIFIWGAQLEAGSFATSYIPTTTASVVRSADVCTIANTSPFWNSSEFTVFTNANFLSSGVDAYASNFNITSGFFGVRRPNTNQASGIIRSFGVSADIPFGANGSFTTGSMRMALAHSTGQQAGSLNGATAIQQNSAFVPSSNPPFNIGYSGTGAYINGYVLAIRYYRKRLPNAKLQALTV